MAGHGEGAGGGTMINHPTKTQKTVDGERFENTAISP